MASLNVNSLSALGNFIKLIRQAHTNFHYNFDAQQALAHKLLLNVFLLLRYNMNTYASTAQIQYIA